MTQDDPEGDDVGGSPLALQFELSAGRIRLRPVTPGRNGSWVKSQVSWSRLDYFWYRGASEERTTAKVGLLKELLALSRVQTSRYYSRYNDDSVWLESIGSRRVWDVLAEAEALGLPLVGLGQRPSDVTLSSDPARPRSTSSGNPKDSRSGRTWWSAASRCPPAPHS